MREFSGEFFIIQQNNAPAHGACKTVKSQLSGMEDIQK